MNPLTCPQCGHQAADAPACPDCGHAPKGKSPPDGRLPPGLREGECRGFDKEAFLAGLREDEQTGGVELKDFIREIEQGATARE